MHYRLGRELKALSKIFTLIGILVNAFLLYHYLGNEYFLKMKNLSKIHLWLSVMHSRRIKKHLVH